MPVARINVSANHTLFFRHPGVRKNTPLAIPTGANAIQWSYGLNTVQQPTFGGAVVQVLSTVAEAMTVTGQTKNNDQLKDIYEWFKEYGQIAGLNHRDEHGVLFQYPERGWGFYIQPTIMPGFKYGVDKIAVDWTITGEVVADTAGDLNKAAMSPFQGENKLFDPSLFSVGFRDRDPRSDPNGDPRALDAAGNYADNFQSLLGAYSSGDFNHWAFDVLARPADNKLDPNSKDFWTQFLGSDFVTGQRANASLGSSVFSGTTGASVLLNADQNIFASGVAGGVGLDFAVVAAWVHAEEPRSRDATAQGHNWLNIGPGQTFPDVQAAINATVAQIKNPNPGYYLDIVASASKSAHDQLTAIWKSPWDGGHYGGDGRNLFASYQAVLSYGLTVDTGVRGKIVGYARAGISAAPIHYGPGGSGPGAGVDFRPPSDFRGKPGHWPRVMDCSLFAALCYLWAGAPDPGNSGFSTAYTGTMLGASNGKKISLAQAQPGDLAIYATHVEVIIQVPSNPTINNVLVATMGSEGGPRSLRISVDGVSGSEPMTIKSYV